MLNYRHFGITSSKFSEPQNSVLDIPVSPTETPSKKNGKFIQSWKINRPWLRFDSKQNLMFCDICIQAQVTNVFTTGCEMMKKESVTKHEKRTGTNKIIKKYNLC